MSTPKVDDVYLDEPYVSIACDRELKFVLSEWKGFANTLEFRAGSIKALEAVRDTDATSLIIDNRRLEGVTPADQLWIRDTLVQLLEATRVRRVAIVVANYGLAKLATDEIRGQTAKSVIVSRTFATVPEAIAWVTS